MNESFQRPANYWLRHADRHKQSGDLIRAAVLQRHAVHAETGSDAARIQYALTLRQMHCYEASNREAFRVLAQQPEQTELYGLIGCNMLALGLRREGLDALDLYFRTTATASMPWHDDACDLADLYDRPFPVKRRQARMNGLFSIAARRIARGELTGAQRALARLRRMRIRSDAPRMALLEAAYSLKQGQKGECLRHIEHALAAQPPRCEVLASAAALTNQARLRRPAYLLMMLAARFARTPADIRIVCHTAASIHMLFIAQAMLRLHLRRHPRRLPLLYDLCVCALKTGNHREALRCIHLCREIDPDDVPSEALFALITERLPGSSPAGLRKAARPVMFYGSCSAEEAHAFSEPLWDAFSEQGFEGLAQTIPKDEHLRKRMMFLLTLPVPWVMSLFAGLCYAMTPADRDASLREVLMQHPAETSSKRFALMQLQTPCICWTRDRFLQADPTRMSAPVPTFRQRRLTIFIHRLAAVLGSAFIPWALGIISRMPPQLHNRIIGDRQKVWASAMTARWNAYSGAAHPFVPLYLMSPARRAAYRRAVEGIMKAEYTL